MVYVLQQLYGNVCNGESVIINYRITYTYWKYAFKHTHRFRSTKLVGAHFTKRKYNWCHDANIQHAHRHTHTMHTHTHTHTPHALSTSNLQTACVLFSRSCWGEERADAVEVGDKVDWGCVPCREKQQTLLHAHIPQKWHKEDQLTIHLVWQDGVIALLCWICWRRGEKWRNGIHCTDVHTYPYSHPPTTAPTDKPWTTNYTSETHQLRTNHLTRWSLIPWRHRGRWKHDQLTCSPQH